jgi:hypothetical protein
MSKVTVSMPTNIRLDPFHQKGIDLVIEKEKEQGFPSSTKSAVIKKALEVYFQQHEISPDMIAEELRKEKED